MLIDIIANIILTLFILIVTIWQSKLDKIRIEFSTYIYLGIFFIINIIIMLLNMEFSIVMLSVGFMLGIINKD